MGFERTWEAEVLRSAPLIAPARQVMWPMQIPGEEDALARGAVQVMVRPAAGLGAGASWPSYLVTAALGFKDPAMPSGVFPCPRAEEICVVAGGYAYLAEAARPEAVTLLGMKPVVEVRAAEELGLLLFVGFQTVLAWGAGGKAWETERLSWEGIRDCRVAGGELRGLGWDLKKDVEVEFGVDLRTGKHLGGGWRT